MRSGSFRSGCEQLVSRPEELVADLTQRDTRPSEATDHGPQERSRATEIVFGFLDGRVAGEPVGGDQATLVIVAAKHVTWIRHIVEGAHCDVAGLGRQLAGLLT